MDCFPTVCIYFFFFLFIFIGSPQKVIIITIFDTHLALYLFFFSSFSLSRCLRRRFWQKERPQKRKERNPKQPQKKDSKKKKKEENYLNSSILSIPCSIHHCSRKRRTWNRSVWRNLLHFPLLS